MIPRWRLLRKPCYASGPMPVRRETPSLDLHRSSPTWVLLAFPSKGRAFAPKIASFGIHRTLCSSSAAVAAAREGSADRKLPSSRARRQRAVAEAQSALTDYLHCTRGLDFVDAEYISNNSKAFLSNLLGQVEHRGDAAADGMAASVTRFLRYHPINEFEPFFESIGVKPRLLRLLLPKNPTFLGDDPLLMQNYRVLCDYGVSRSRMGKMYVEASEIFRYGATELACKLEAYEGVGLGKSDVASIVAACPRLLIGGVDGDFVRLLEELQTMGIDRGWIAENVRAKHTYVWHRMSWLLTFLGDLGLSKQETAMLVRKQPGFLLDGSGKTALQIVAMLLKLGAARREISELLSHFPRVNVADYLKNLQAALRFLVDIHMKFEDIKVVVLAHPDMLGSCALLKPGSVRSLLGVGRKRLRDIIEQDPSSLLRYVKGAKIEPLPETKEGDNDSMRKKRLMISLGLVEDQKDMVETLSSVRGKPDELQRKYMYLTEKGFGHDGIVKMIKAMPRVMQQSLESLKSKVEFLVDRSGYPVEHIVIQPRCLQSSMEKIELRVLMYNWLRSNGKIDRELSLTTILRYSEESFVEMHVNRCPEGPEIWDKFRRAVYAC